MTDMNHEVRTTTVALERDPPGRWKKIMQLIMFAKHLKSLAIPELVKRAKQFGIDGYDWPVRPGYAVNPQNVATALPEFARAMQSEGMTVPMCTADGFLSNPEEPTVEPTLAAMGATGAKYFKIGYDKFVSDRPYWQQVDEARARLEKWQALGRKHGVMVCCHTHSGPYLGCNASAVMHLVRGFDPRIVGAYLDAGHLSIAGEPFPMACAIAGDHLKIVGVKDLRKVWGERDGKAVVQIEAVPKGKGLTDPALVFGTLVRLGFDGPVTIHIEYPGSLADLLRASELETRSYREDWMRAIAAAGGPAGN